VDTSIRQPISAYISDQLLSLLIILFESYTRKEASHGPATASNRRCQHTLAVTRLKRPTIADASQHQQTQAYPNLADTSHSIVNTADQLLSLLVVTCTTYVEVT
jgi:hypothetical protein